MACLCQIPLDSQAQRYVQMSGEIHIGSSTWDVGEEPPKSVKDGDTNGWSVSFVCTVGTNEWELDGNFTKNGRVKWFFDGTNLFQSLQITREPDARDANDKEFGFMSPPLEKVRSNLTINVFVKPDGYPRTSVSVNVPWLALCSGTLLKRPDRAVPLPVALFDLHSPGVFGYADQTKTFADELGLPQAVELFTSKAKFAAALNEPSAKAFYKKRPECIPANDEPDGVSKFRYAVTQSTNFLGWNIPIAFEFAGVYPSFPGRLRSHSGTGRIVAIGNASKPNGVFDSSLNQTIVDWRFGDKSPFVNAIIYPSTNAFLQPMDTPLLQETFARTAKQNAEGHARQMAEEQQSTK